MLVKVLVLLQCSLRQLWQLPTPCATASFRSELGWGQRSPWAGNPLAVCAA